jgi:hypothetical protein
VWQAAFGELFLNQGTKDGLVHDGLAAFTDSTARFTGVSAPGGANRKAEVQAKELCGCHPLGV